jgi:Rrf2 family protein
MSFSKTMVYGLRALAYLARARHRGEGLRGLQEIANSEKIPPVYLGKVMNELRRHRLLRSVKGVHGGYELARSPETITLWEVFQVLEPDPYLDRCVMGYGDCNQSGTCALHQDWQIVRGALVKLLQDKTISEIAAGPDQSFALLRLPDTE